MIKLLAALNDDQRKALTRMGFPTYGMRWKKKANGSIVFSDRYTIKADGTLLFKDDVVEENTFRKLAILETNFGWKFADETYKSINLKEFEVHMNGIFERDNCMIKPKTTPKKNTVVNFFDQKIKFFNENTECEKILPDADVKLIKIESLDRSILSKNYNELFIEYWLDNKGSIITYHDDYVVFAFNEKVKTSEKTDEILDLVENAHAKLRTTTVGRARIYSVDESYEKLIKIGEETSIEVKYNDVSVSLVTSMIDWDVVDNGFTYTAVWYGDVVLGQKYRKREDNMIITYVPRRGIRLTFSNGKDSDFMPDYLLTNGLSIEEYLKILPLL